MNRFFEAQQSSFPPTPKSMFLPQQFHRIQAQKLASSSHRSQDSSAPAVPSMPSPSNNGEPRPLPDFVAPGRFDVICARGSAAANHSGNLRFRNIIKQRLPEYSKAKNKLEKSLIVSSIVDAVRDYTPNGGFVKQDSNGQWYDVGDALAREKIGQCIRDQLHSKYKSSTKAKKQRRKAVEKQKTDTGRVTPVKSIDKVQSFNPFTRDEEGDDGERCGSGRITDESNKEMQKDGDALALMLAPIGESFAIGGIEGL